MFESKYSKVLTIFLIIVIIAIIVLLGFLGYDYYQKYFITKDTSEFVDSFEGDQTIAEENNDSTTETNTAENENVLEQVESTTTTTKTGTTKVKKQYKGLGVDGTIQIPKTKVKYPVLEKVTNKSIETAVAILYGVGLNQPGNTVIVGHNYRNGLFFSNNKKLQNGDKIYITDNTGTKLTYTIYNKFETTPEDTSFYTRDTAGKPEITLSTCTDDSSARIIIFAKAD